VIPEQSCGNNDLGPVAATQNTNFIFVHQNSRTCSRQCLEVFGGDFVSDFLILINRW
jgi:hypothetical protein